MKKTFFVLLSSLVVVNFIATIKMASLFVKFVDKFKDLEDFLQQPAEIDKKKEESGLVDIVTPGPKSS